MAAARDLKVVSVETGQLHRVTVGSQDDLPALLAENAGIERADQILLTAEGGKVGPVGTFLITVLLVFLFGASFFFTSVPRNAIEGLVDLSDDPNAPTQRF